MPHLLGTKKSDANSDVFLVQIELLDTVALNLHRIDKDVQRCDRNYYYFNTANLEKLRNIMCRCVGHTSTSLTLPPNVTWFHAVLGSQTDFKDII